MVVRECTVKVLTGSLLSILLENDHGSLFLC
jgi:hypothetical protein